MPYLSSPLLLVILATNPTGTVGLNPEAVWAAATKNGEGQHEYALSRPPTEQPLPPEVLVRPHEEKRPDQLKTPDIDPVITGT